MSAIFFTIEEPQAETWHMCEDIKQTDSPTVRFFSKVSGGLQKHNKDFPLYLKNFNFIEVSSSDLCDVILNFCPAEVGPYIEDILKETTECPSVRVHKIVPRSIKNHISSFKICLDNSPNVTQVDTSEWSDVTLAFCPIVSRVGTDIEATLKDIEDSKPAILVVMHHTFDEQYVIPDTKRFGKNKDILIVDCVFHEDLGLLPCKTNKKALEQIKMYLMHEEGKKKTSQSVDSSSVTQKSFRGFIDYTYDLTRYSLAQIERLISWVTL